MGSTKIQIHRQIAILPTEQEIDQFIAAAEKYWKHLYKSQRKPQ